MKNKQEEPKASEMKAARVGLKARTFVCYVPLWMDSDILQKSTQPDNLKVFIQENLHQKVSHEPASEIQDKILFMINNISASDMDVKAKEFIDVLKEQYYPWFAQYMVMKRASIEPNFHELYLKFLEKVNSRILNKEIVKATNENCKVPWQNFFVTPGCHCYHTPFPISHGQGRMRSSQSFYKGFSSAWNVVLSSGTSNNNSNTLSHKEVVEVVVAVVLGQFNPFF